MKWSSGGTGEKGRIGEAEDGFKEQSLKQQQPPPSTTILEKESVERGDGRH